MHCPGTEQASSRASGFGPRKTTHINDDAIAIDTSTGPILLAANPFCRIDGLHLSEAMEWHRRRVEGMTGHDASNGGKRDGRWVLRGSPLAHESIHPYVG